MNQSSHRPASAGFFKLINNPFKFRLYLLKNLPAAYFSGLKIRSVSEQACTVSIPFKWFTKNPFRSTYFACLSMAAELTTGLLAMAYVYKRQPAVSMLVTDIQGKFLKKATGITTFTCADGEIIKGAIATAVSAGQAQVVKARSIGMDKMGNAVAEFWFSWSFKAK